MSNMKNSSVRRSDKKLKGFTLIEMLVVLAVLVILGATITIPITAYIRDARVESNNEKAKLVYEAFQNLLINAEVTQDDSMFRMWDRDNTEHGDLANVVIWFEISKTNRDGSNNNGLALGDTIDVMNYYEKPGATNTHVYEPTFYGSSNSRGLLEKNCTTGYDAADIARKKALYERYENELIGNLTTNCEGRYQVSINYKDYTIDSVLYQEPNTGATQTINFAGAHFKKADYNNGVTTVRSTAMGTAALFDYMYCYVDNIFDHRTLEAKGEHFGIYPYEDDKT